MERETRAVVFECEKPAELQLIKSKLEGANIPTFTQNSYMSFISTPTADRLKLQVNLTDEKQALDIIDAYLQETDVKFKKDSMN